VLPNTALLAEFFNSLHNSRIYRMGRNVRDFFLIADIFTKSETLKKSPQKKRCMKRPILVIFT